MVFHGVLGLPLLFGGTDCTATFLDDMWTASLAPSWPDESCTGGDDEDGDELADCADPDCNAEPTCGPIELCDDGVDNDGDGQVDCTDPNCGGTSCAVGMRCVADSCR